MKLTASVIVRNERDRYLVPFVEHLLAFCDEVRALDDGSTDGTYDLLRATPGVVVKRTDGPAFFEHEGKARNALLEHTLAGSPTHVLAIDADEFVADGPALRAELEAPVPGPTRRANRAPAVWKLPLSEVWCVRPDGLDLRMDGGWKTRHVPILWAVPPRERDVARLHIRNRELACGREPENILKLYGSRRVATLDVPVLHFGWSNPETRRERYERYAEHDGGSFHAKRHLDSILAEERYVWLEAMEWPEGLADYREAILERAGAAMEAA